jgi:GAF domain-containing protein
MVQKGAVVMENARNALSDFTASKVAALDVHKAVCKDIIDHVCSSRASIWYFNAANDALVRTCSLDTRTGTFDFEPVTLSARDAALYFDEILHDGVINAADVESNPCTQCFHERYSKPYDVVSLYDMAIKIGPRPVAVLCCESCTTTRQWSQADENYLANMAVLLRISFMVEQRAPRR